MQNALPLEKTIFSYTHALVFQSGRPYYEVELGRYDGRVSMSTRDGVVLPHANFNLDQLNAFFSGLGFTQPEMVALSGKQQLQCTSLVLHSV